MMWSPSMTGLRVAGSVWPRRAAGHLLVVLAVALPGLAAHAAVEPPGQVVVRNTTARMLEALRRDREEISAHPARIYNLVADIILPHFDFDRMSRRVLGKHWRRASRAQRERFVQEFRTLLVRTYATALSEYRDQNIRYLKPRARDDTELTVRTQIEQQGGPPIPIDYQLYRTADSWKVYDVVIDGVSLVVNYRSSFSAEIRKGGIDGLIARLAEHNGPN